VRPSSEKKVPQDTVPLPSASRSPSVTQLFAAFFRLGATAFGGPAMIAYMRTMAVEQHQWLADDTFRDGVVLCQTIPGATAMQMSAYVGLRVRGVAGAVVSFLGFGLPAFLLMLALSALYARTQTLPTVVAVFRGLQVIVIAIVADATVSFGTTTLKDWRTVLIALGAAGLFGARVHPVVVILGALGCGLLLHNGSQPPQKSASAGGSLRTTRPLAVLITVTAVGFLLLFLAERQLFDLAVLMSRIDVLAFGGGFASVPLMFHEIVEVRSWMTGPTFLNGIVLGQVTPGPIVITATFIGYWLQGLQGAVVATLSVFSPSFLMVVGLAPYFDRLRAAPRFDHAMRGILCSFVGLLLAVTLRFAADVSWDIGHVLLVSAAFVALRLQVDIFYMVLAGVVIALVL
jgi:chromate transporter